MKRRGFLKRLLGAATAAVVSEQVIPDDGVALRSMAHPMHPSLAHETNPLSEMGNLYIGPGLAPLKATELYEHHRWVTSRRLFDFRRRVIDPVEIEVREGDGADLYHLMRFKTPHENLLDYPIRR